MKPTDQDIEKILHNAPKPSPPPELREKIEESIPRSGARSAGATGSRPGWLRPWWPALASTGLAVAALAVVTTQRSQINALKESVEDLKQAVRAQEQAMTVQSSRSGGTPGSQAAQVPLARGRAELDRLRAETERLQAEVARIEALAPEAEQMRAELGKLARQAMPEEMQALDEAREKAMRIQCVNNLKQLGLAARVWAADNQGVFPPNIHSMSNELVTPKVLVCPADTSRQVAESWDNFGSANMSYEFLAANGTETEPQRVLFKCPIHNNVCLCDGSVHQLSTERAQRELVWQGGKLWYYANPPPITPPRGGPPPGAMEIEMMRRYGLLPPDDPAALQVPPDGTAPDPNAIPQPQMDIRMMQRYGLLPPDFELPAEEVEPAEPAPEEPR